MILVFAAIISSLVSVRTAACVPTATSAGVSISPCGVFKIPIRAPVRFDFLTIRKSIIFFIEPVPPETAGKKSEKRAGGNEYDGPDMVNENPCMPFETQAIARKVL